MKKYVAIGLGGFLGAILRVVIKDLKLFSYDGAFPLNTLIINVSGCLLLSLLLTIAFEVWEMDESVRLGIATGFLGAYTTFSTLCKETVSLLTNGDYTIASLYIILSTGLGLLAVYLGIIVAREYIAKIIGQNNPNDEDCNDVG